MSSKYVKDVRRKIKLSAIPVTSTWHVPADLSYWEIKKKKKRSSLWTPTCAYFTPFRQTLFSLVTTEASTVIWVLDSMPSNSMQFTKASPTGKISSIISWCLKCFTPQSHVFLGRREKKMQMHWYLLYDHVIWTCPRA